MKGARSAYAPGLDVDRLASLVLLEYDGCLGEDDYRKFLFRGDEGGVIEG